MGVSLSRVYYKINSNFNFLLRKTTALIVISKPSFNLYDLNIYSSNIYNYPMSSIKRPIFKGQKRVFPHRFLTLFLSSNHYMLWSVCLIPLPNHYTSSELLPQRDVLSLFLILEKTN